MRPLTMCCWRKSDHAVEDENGNETSLRHDDGLLYERDINEGDLVTMDGQHQLWKL